MTKVVKYKETGLEWCPQIPEHWEMKKLKYVALVQPSNVDKKSEKDEISVLLCNYVDVYKNDFITNHLPFMEATAKENEIKKYQLVIGDVIITKDSETAQDIAVPAYVKETKDNLLCGYHLAQIRSNNIDIQGKYLFRLFQSKMFNSNFEIGANGVTRYGLGVEVTQSAIALLPPLTKQQKISDYLDKKTSLIDSIIVKKEKQIELFKEERTAVINHAVTKGLNPDTKMKDSGIEWLGEIPEHWEVKKLKYLICLRNESIETYDFTIAVENIESSTGKLVKMKEEKKYIGCLSCFREYDILFNKLRPYLHKVYFAEQDGGSYGELLTLIVLKGIHPKLMYYILFNKPFIDVVDGSTQGSKMPRANWDGFINQLRVVYPTVSEEQQQIVSYLDQETQRIDTLIEKTTKQINLLKEYKEALINEVVTGQRIVD